MCESDHLEAHKSLILAFELCLNWAFYFDGHVINASCVFLNENYYQLSQLFVMTKSLTQRATKEQCTQGVSSMSSCLIHNHNDLSWTSAH